MFEGEIQWKSDVWGIGCLLYEMASGLPLYYSVRHQTRERLRAAVSNVILVTSQTEMSLTTACTVWDYCTVLSGVATCSMDVVRQLQSTEVVVCICVIYGGTRSTSTPTFGLRGTVPPLFRTKRWRICCHLTYSQQWRCTEINYNKTGWVVGYFLPILSPLTSGTQAYLTLLLIWYPHFLDRIYTPSCMCDGNRTSTGISSELTVIRQISRCLAGQTLDSRHWTLHWDVALLCDTLGIMLFIPL